MNEPQNPPIEVIAADLIARAARVARSVALYAPKPAIPRAERLRAAAQVWMNPALRDAAEISLDQILNPDGDDAIISIWRRYDAPTPGTRTVRAIKIGFESGITIEIPLVG